MIRPLPNWVLVNKFPAFYDTESLTSVEQTARVYGKMNELIESYNKYVEEINKSISDLETEKHADVQEFICRISCLTDNYINTVDMKIAHQDRKIAEVYSQFSEDIINTFKLFLSDLYTTGELDNAIYEALDNIKVKVDSFIAECEQFKAEMTADYESIKSGLNADYTEKKAALEGDYNTVKANLESDYAAKKGELEGDYNTVKANLESDYTEKKGELTDSVSGYTDMYDNKGVVLYEGSIEDNSDYDNGTTYSILVPNLLKYKIVCLEFESYTGPGITMLGNVTKSKRVSESTGITYRSVDIQGMGNIATSGYYEDNSVQMSFGSIQLHGKFESDDTDDAIIQSFQAMGYVFDINADGYAEKVGIRNKDLTIKKIIGII